MASVAVIYLPAGGDGMKQGVDDYLAAGHTTDELLHLATTQIRRPPAEDRSDSAYRATPDGLVFEKPTQNGSVSIPLTNFVAAIKCDVIEDDGVEARHVYVVEATLNEHRSVFDILSSQFPSMNWVAEHLGATAIVYAGSGVKDHARVAIQTLSDDVQTRRVFIHTGWREVDEEWVYLTAGARLVGLVGLRTYTQT